MLSVIIVILVSLLVSAFFSGIEIAFLSSNKLKLEIDRKQNKVFDYVAEVFSRSPGQYITTVLVGNSIVLVVYSMYMSMLIKEVVGIDTETYLGSASVLVETVISTIVIIFAGEFIPKMTVNLNPNFYYKVLSIPAYLVYVVLYPIAKFGTLLSTGILRLFGVKPNNGSHVRKFDRVDLEHLVDTSVDNAGGSSDQSEKDIKLFQNALDFSGLTVRDCMVQRVDIEAVPADTTMEDLSRRFVDSGFSRLLVYENNIDNITGYVNLKSLFSDPDSISEIMKPVDYVPESMPAQKLLTKFIKTRHSVAVVIDEFGGTAGMVTIEDVLEEIFGEIEDEHDAPETVEKMISDSEFIFSGRLEVEYLNEKYNLDIPESEEYDTLAGCIIYNYQGFPAMGETVSIGDKKIKILRTTASKLELVRLTIT